jgi:hypothetical protein
MALLFEEPIIPTSAPPVPGLVLSIPFLTKGIEGGIMARVERSVLDEKNLDELDLGDGGDDALPLRADAGTTRLDDCFHILSGDRENCLSSILTDPAGEFVLFVDPFSTMTNPPLLLSSECWDVVVESLRLY